jgi:hypothetical protein
MTIGRLGRKAAGTTGSAAEAPVPDRPPAANEKHG